MPENEGMKREQEEEPDAQPQQPPSKKKKKSHFSEFRDLPTSGHYQVSFMHRAVVTHVIHSWKHAYVITASSDGMVKFWKRTQVDPPVYHP
jgi:peptidylprolyl isomerase domain and WD repeat-containing protein 1